jgi:hypothetical protein
MLKKLATRWSRRKKQNKFGRWKVSVQSSINQIQDVASTVQFTSIDNEAVKKRGRGRPRKSGCESTGLAQAVTERGRGRPRKIKIESTGLAQAFTKRGRGRPRKIKCFNFNKT